ncbi:hypothetical protein T4E_5247, partial [Trichinella pseudospiralis]
LGQRIKAPRNKTLIYGRAASRGIVSKTVRRSDCTDPPQCPPAAKSFAHPIGAVKTSRNESGGRRVVREEVNLKNDDTKKRSRFRE